MSFLASLIVFTAFALTLTAAQISFKSCSYNEMCVDIKICPTYKAYATKPFQTWPTDLKQSAKTNICNRETVDQQQVLSVCCPTVMNPKNCGVQASDRIAKGTVAKVFDFSWMVLLRDRDNKFVCGGTLLSKRYVLTAAHCLRSAEIISVRLGENDINQPIDCNVVDTERDCAPEPQDIKIEKPIRHPRHSDRAKKNDIALLRLERAATLGDSVRPICLPNGTPKERSINPAFFVVSGWGLTENGTSFDVLRYARVPPVTLSDCEPRLRILDPSGSLRLDERQVCAGGVDQIDNCAGDSGGPLHYISNQTSRYIQYGVVSYGLRSCGLESEPGIYTNVMHYLSWIFEIVDE